MLRVKFMTSIALLGLLCACNGGEHAVSKEHKARATEMCKHDKGLKEVIDADGASFTARCASGIIVAGIAELNS